jgi:hypothetical protein
MRTHPAQENEVADLRHIDAGGEQIDGHCDAGQALVLVAQDGLVRFVGAAGDLHHRFVVERSPDLLQRFSQQLHDQIGVMVVGAEDQGFLFAGGVDLLGQFVADDAVEGGVMTRRLKASISKSSSSGRVAVSTVPVAVLTT